MFIFTMSRRASPYFASNSSSKIASSNVFEQSSPMLNTIGLEILPILRDHMVGRHRRLAAHADERQARQALFEGLVEGQRVGRVGVAAPGRCENLIPVRSPPPARPSSVDMSPFSKNETSAASM
jgi:hypothetical protein